MVLNDKNEANIDQISASLDARDPIERIVYHMLYQKITSVTGPIKLSSLPVS